jgi:ubiquitin carboxyl-terminal hydrolase MINDY-3/4
MELTQIVWGNDIKQDNFERWSQGFIFENKKEQTALLQYSGGPCAVIAAVQAFLIKELLFCHKCGDNWRTCDGNLY